jgi:hypothetical protein
MAQATCAVEGCPTHMPAPGGARGMCQKHYKRWKKHGDPLKVFPRGYRGVPDEPRFLAKVDKNGPVPGHRPDLGPCWLWTAARDKHGYGAFGIASSPDHPDRKERIVRAHRFSYELEHGPVDANLDLDHLCRNPPCVNPAHLEPVTHRVNVLRGIAPSAQHARKDSCPQGHEYDLLKDGERRCSRCDKDNSFRRARIEEGPLIKCACGCGGILRQIGGGRVRRFIHGHNAAVRKVA